MAIPANIASINYLNDAARDIGAVCLDGSSAAYYMRVEPGGEINKIFVFQEGGGWCVNDLDCYSRSQTSLGSSTGYASTINLGNGSLSNDPRTNPLMWNWTKIYAKYCDGGSQTGDVFLPIPIPATITTRSSSSSNSTSGSTSSTNIYYRGARIARALISHLLNTTTLNTTATDLIVSGCSAGGLSTFLHADTWRAAVPARVKVTALIDSGFFLNYNYSSSSSSSAATPSATSDISNIPYGSALRWLFHRMNSTAAVPQACLDANQEDPALCIFAENVVPFIKTPLFLLQSKYDNWQQFYILKSTQRSAMNNYGALLVSRVLKAINGEETNDRRIHNNKYNNKNNNKNAVFLDSCSHHCGEWGMIEINGDNQAAALQKWYNDLARDENSRTSSSSIECSDGGACSSGSGRILLVSDNVNNYTNQQASIWFQNRSFPCANCCMCMTYSPLYDALVVIFLLASMCMFHAWMHKKQTSKICFCRRRRGCYLAR